MAKRRRDWGRPLGPANLAVSAETDAFLHHSRFAFEDRLRLDRQLLGIFDRMATGEELLRPRRKRRSSRSTSMPDLLITDACPADVLLQRWVAFTNTDREPGHARGSSTPATSYQ